MKNIEAKDIRIMLFQFVASVIGLWMTINNDFSNLSLLLSGGVLLMISERGIYKREEIY